MKHAVCAYRSVSFVSSSIETTDWMSRDDAALGVPDLGLDTELYILLSEPH